MAELKPCGTEAAYRRHKRRGEPVDPACEKAHAETVAANRARATAAETGHLRALLAEDAPTQLPPPEAEPRVDVLAAHRDNLRIVEAAMKAASPAAIANLSKRRQELTERIATLERATTEKTLEDQLANRRAAGSSRRSARRAARA